MSANMHDYIRSELPNLRRYGRAITGHQVTADCAVISLMQQYSARRMSNFDSDILRLSLYRDLSKTLADKLENGISTPDSRRAHFLTSVQKFTFKQTGHILNISEHDARTLHQRACDEIKKLDKARILIIEDEAFISTHLCSIVEELDHSVTSVVRTREEAVEAAQKQMPTLILSDIHLADGSSGIDAVDEIRTFCDAPTIFITAYPDRLLTGDRQEPLFLINKPFDDAEIAASISQAIFVAHETKH